MHQPVVKYYTRNKKERDRVLKELKWYTTYWLQKFREEQFTLLQNVYFRLGMEIFSSCFIGSLFICPPLPFVILCFKLKSNIDFELHIYHMHIFFPTRFGKILSYETNQFNSCLQNCIFIQSFVSKETKFSVFNNFKCSLKKYLSL